MQRTQFTFPELCSYIIYRAMEEERTTNKGLFESNKLCEEDCSRVSNVLEKIVGEGQIAVASEGDNKVFVKK